MSSLKYLVHYIDQYGHWPNSANLTAISLSDQEQWQAGSFKHFWKDTNKSI